ncbi:MAG: elongation factor P [Candidatus Omnitrophica bacterium]|nr:elongation factor P [Candidatus Omnitrophota bacterium]
MFIHYQGNLHEVIDFQHGTPGNKRGFVQLKIKDILNGKIITTKFSSNDTVEQISLDSRSVQYLYKDHTGYHFMDMNDYHTFFFDEKTVGDDKSYLVENMELTTLFHNEHPVKIQLPRHITLEVIESEPWIKGDSVSNNTKPVTLVTGLKIQAPLFVNTGDKLKIDTQEGKYLSRE